MQAAATVTLQENYRHGAGIPGSTLRNSRSAGRTIHATKSDHRFWSLDQTEEPRLELFERDRLFSLVFFIPSSQRVLKKEIGCFPWSSSSPSSQDVLHAIGFHPSLGDVRSRCGYYCVSFSGSTRRYWGELRYTHRTWKVWKFSFSTHSKTFDTRSST
jgi:hypothetical protein